MQKVMIVDDEFRIREGLREIIAWEEYDACIVSEARNGQEALQKMQQEMPDIMIVDIEMPVMNGLELIREIDARDIPVQIIVLSGYDHFEYVKSAMRHGAVNYLLKPLESEELVLTLAEIVEGLQEKEKRKLQQEEAFRQMRTNLLNRILNDEAYTADFEEKMAYTGVDLNFSDTFVALLSDCSRALKTPAARRRTLCEEGLAPAADCLVFDDKHGRTAVIVKDMPQRTEAFTRALDGIIRRLQADFGANVVFSLGRTVGDYRELHKSYRQAVEGLEYMLIYGANQVIDCEAVAHAEGGPRRLPDIDLESLRRSVSTFDEAALAAYIRDFFRHLEQHSQELTPRDIHDLAKTLLMSIALEAEKNSHNKSLYLDLYDEALLEEINSADTFDTLRGIVEKMARRMMALHIENHQSSGAKLPRDILEYVHRHYNDSGICLKSLAYRFGFSSTHLGRIFKGATGEYFSNYVNNVRIRRAKHLLSETTMKIKDIADETGFSNVGYFYTIFKKNVGCNPTEYRNAQVSPQEREPV